MKAIKTKLVCYNRWGSECFKKEYPSKRQAVDTAKSMIDNGFASSYKMRRIEQ